MAYKVEKKLTIENAHIIFKNFSGKESQYNRAGNRNFCVVIDNEDDALQLREDGWNIREYTNDNGTTYYVQAQLRFDNTPPKVVMVTNGRMTNLTEETVGELDFAEIISADVVLNPYNWTVRGTTGVKAYVKTLYVTVAVDEFEDKYSNMRGYNETPFD